MGAKKCILVLSALFLSCILYGQQAKMVLDGGVRRDMMSQDALQFYRKPDLNGNICAILKVTLTNSIGDNPLSLNVGAMGVVDREVKENGEIWFYVPYQVKRLNFSCKSYQPMDPIEVNLEEGGVYLLKIRNDAIVQSYLIADVQSNFLKVETDPVDASLAYGKDAGCSMGSEYLTDGFFTRQLDYGEYYISVSHQLYKTKLQKVSVSEKNEIAKVKLDPDYGYLTVRSNPEGAMVFINGEKMDGTTPFALNEKIKRGTVRIRVQKDEYHPAERTVDVPGTGERLTVNMEMKPNFGTVVVSCEDSEAEIWIDNERKGKGRWTGKVSSGVNHTLESRKARHQSQGIGFRVSDGENIERSIAAPTPLYGSIAVSQTNPAYCQVLIDGEDAGTAPFVKNRLLIGSHTVEFRKDGYIPLQRTVEIAQNKSFTVSGVALEKGKRKVKLTVATDDSSASIYADGRLLAASGEWTGELDEGFHEFSTTRSGHNPGKARLEVVYGKTIRLKVPSPVRKTGTVNFDGTRNAEITLRGTDFHKYGLKIPTSITLPIGKYTASASKKGFKDAVSAFTVYEGQTTETFIKLKKEYWISEYQGFSSHFGEISYGYAIPYASTPRPYYYINPHWVGVNYAYVPTHIGVNASFAASMDGSVSLAVGPAMRFTSYIEHNVDFQLYAGFGFRYDPTNLLFEDPLFHSRDWRWMVDAGVRFNFSDELDFSFSSFSLGAKISSDMVIPTVGMALYPGLLAMCERMDPHHYFGLNTACDVSEDEWMAGGYYTWVPSALGLYSSFLVGFDGGYSILAGPVISCFPGNSDTFDLMLYGGIGVQNSSLAGDFGIRFAFLDDNYRNLGWWDIGIGCQIYDGHFVPTLSMSFFHGFIWGWIMPLLGGLGKL
ncbi:MAG: PEGA domain-containing protein [Candidatus Cryptobacteroides sp.]